MNKNTLVFGFRGTVMFSREVVGALENWLLNADFILEKLPWQEDEDVKVHQGMLQSYYEIRDQVFERVNQVFNEEKEISHVRFLGSSLGGALSTLALVDFATRTDTPEKFQAIMKRGDFHSATNGCPRVGNKGFYEYTRSIYNNSDNYRLTNKKDPIPQLPLKATGYHHLPTEYFFEDDDVNYKECDGSGEDPTCQAKLWPSVVIDDHLTYLGIDSTSGFGDNC